MIQRIKDRIAIKVNEFNCKRGKHRWAKITIKSDDGVTIKEVCQSCPKEKDASL